MKRASTSKFNVFSAWLPAIFGLLFSTVTHAQSAMPQAMLFERLSIEDGLSQSNVMDVVQDHSGFLWFATENGLNRYDGYTFQQFHRGDAGTGQSLTSDFISDLSVDRSGDVWMATDGGGVVRWHAETGKLSVLQHDPNDPSSIAADTVQAILADARGRVWIGTRRNGLNQLNLDTGEITHYVHDAADENSLSSDMILDLAIDDRGTVWIATENGLSMLDPERGEVTRYFSDPNNPNTLSQNSLHSVFVDRGGMIWVGTESGGLNRFDPRRSRFTRYVHDPEDESSLSNNRVQVIFEDNAERLWVGTSRGLNLMNRADGTFSRYHHSATDPSSLGSDNIVSLFQDDSSVLWVGTKIAGLSKWNPRSWAFGHVAPSRGNQQNLGSPHVSSFTESLDGRIWVGTFGGGLDVFDRDLRAVERFQNNPKNPQSLSDDRIMALHADSRDRVWVGTMGGGLNRIDQDTGEISVFRHDPDDATSLAANGVMSIFEDSKQRIWIGTFGGGINRYDEASGSFTRLTPTIDEEVALADGRITAMAETKDGLIWFGTDGAGLFSFDERTGTWHNWRYDPADTTTISGNTVYTLHVDRNGTLWVGTRTGLDQTLRDASTGEPIGFLNVTRKYNFANDTIYGVQSDIAGKIWASTNYGLTSFEPDSGKLRNYHRSHGLQGEEFNFGAHYASVDGRLFFGGSNGFNAFYPTRVFGNSRPPTVVLTKFLKLNKPAVTDVPYEKLGQVDLAYEDDVVTFEFAALDYVSPDKNRYAYKLEGFDKDWIQAGAERRITYTNLDGGDYTLRVKAANSDGIWSEQELAVPFHVEPSPWKSWWAYVSYAVLTCSAFLSLLLVQRRKLAREAEYRVRLEQEVSDRTRELAERNDDLRIANSRLQEVSHTDALTGLRNRRYLFDEIAKDIDLLNRNRSVPRKGRRKASNEEFVFIMIDLDQFKPVNDNIGHQAGDEMLLQVRDCLLSSCRSSDIVIRWGGDEFLVVARQTNREEAAALVERIRASIADRVFDLGGGNTARSSTSIGFAPYPFFVDQPDKLNWEQVLGVADIAMYRAKSVRNAWSGVYGLEWQGDVDSFLAALQGNAESVAESGAIHIIDSLSMSVERTA